MANHYRTIVPNAYGGGTTYRGHIVNPTTRDDAYAVAARIPGAYVQVSANGVTGWQDDAPAPAVEPAVPAAPRVYTARRIAQRFYEHTGADEFTPGDEFNVDATPYAEDDESLTFDSVSELVDAVRRDGVTFDATGADWATDPDGSHIIDYATSARESVSWHFGDVAPAILARVIVPAVNAR